MNLEKIKDLATSRFARQVLIAQKHSPKVLFVAGVVGVVGTTVLACRATLKVSDVLDQHEAQKKNIENLVSPNAGSQFSEPHLLTEEQANKELARTKVKTGLEIAKLYAPAVGLGVVSIAALTGSHVVLSRRNAGLMAAYAAVHKSFEEYRGRVVTMHGEEEDRRFATGIEMKNVEGKLANGQTKITKVATRTGRFGGSPYAALFDEKSSKFTREPGMNPQVLMMIQNWANEKFRARGHLFLNEVYDMLDLPRTKAGQHVGWVHRRDNEEKIGDNYVSFGVYDDVVTGEAFVEGEEPAIWLDFNVAGVILDLI